MRKKLLRKRRTVIIPMSRTSRSSSNLENTSFLPSITYFFFASNSIGAMCRAYGRADYSLLAFIILEYSAFVLLNFCSSAYRRLPLHEKSLKKDLLKFAIWFLSSAIMFGVAYQFAPYFPQAAMGLSLYAVVTVGSAFLFYVYLILDVTSGRDECSIEETRKFSECDCSSVGNVSEKKIQRCYSVLEKV